MCFTSKMFAQMFLEFSNLSPCCKCRKVVAVSEHSDVLDCMFVQTRVEHSNAVPCRPKIEFESCKIIENTVRF